MPSFASGRWFVWLDFDQCEPALHHQALGRNPQRNASLFEHHADRLRAITEQYNEMAPGANSSRRSTEDSIWHPDLAMVDHYWFAHSMAASSLPAEFGK
jgi:hypothetical protein